MPQKPAVETFTIVVDGKEVEARKGEVVIAAAERAGVYIPRFCWHPRMEPVGMCRMCVVDIKGPRGWALQPACYVPAAPGMEIDTRSQRTKKAQDGILEFLLINHPLDCPVCDKGGECPLQDHTLAFGPGESRMVEEKRHFEKPVPVSELVLLDRERCIFCARCTRFADEVAGDPFLTMQDRGNGSQVNTFPDHPFASYFSGNTVQICPVGALTSAQYRFTARPWDLEQVESTCQSCSVGCRMAVQSTANVVTRHLGLDSEPVNQGWLCDRGRYDHGALSSDARLAAPLVRKGGELVEASWGEALDAAAEGLRKARDLHGPASLALLGGSRLSNESAYAWAKLAKGVLGTDNVDCQLADGLPAELVLSLPKATIEDATYADVVILLGPDVKEELPVLYLRLKGAVDKQGVKVIEVAPRTTGFSTHAAATLVHQPGQAPAVVQALLAGADPAESVAGVEKDALAAARRLLAGAASVVAIVGRPSLAESADYTAQAAVALRDGIPGIRFLSGLRRGNVHGALDLGLAPGVLPGRVALADGRDHAAEAWGSAPAEVGLDATGICDAAAEGRIRGLVLLGADPLTDLPDRELARRAVTGAAFVVAIDGFLSRSAEQADVVLPASLFDERPGTTTNLEQRVTTISQKVVAPGLAWADWMIAAELAFSLGADLGFASLQDVQDEMVRVAPSFAGLTPSVLGARAHRDGLVVPLGSAPPPAEPAPTDPTANPGVAAPEAHQGAGGVGAEGDREVGAESDVEGTDATGDAGFAAGPAMLSTYVAPTTAPPKPDAYKLRLVSSRVLYDAATTVQQTPILAKLAPAPALHVHPSDLTRFSLADGATVRATSARGSATFTAVADTRLPKGSCWLPFNVGASGAADLIDLGAPVTDITVESA